ncbi:protein kinase (plasmid) [Lacticaseibacillus paracasei]|uniref:protein kinase domain-containing protein n=1 Tax=Lacticaseibacillus paracasei TaxID=1597 RepID=UPI00384C94E1
MKKNNWHDFYDEISLLGMGGNGKVYKVNRKKDNELLALKELYQNSKEKKERFEREVQIVTQNQQTVSGIIPICNSDLKDYWYTMPIAIPIMKYIDDNQLEMLDIIKGTIFLCSTLETLHQKNIEHRDIKPDNIYFYKGKFCFSDFGLADCLENTNDDTKTNKGLGAIFTIAPEMKRDPRHADAKKADVFSLAKTLWMLLTGDKKGFDGEYDYSNKKLCIYNKGRAKGKHTAEIEMALRDATNSDPENRPTISQFKKELENWVNIYRDGKKSQESDWRFIKTQMFGKYSPRTVCWENNTDIVNILNIVGSSAGYNHMLFSSQGGLDFSSAKNANEESCIELCDTTGFYYVGKPKMLSYESFDNNSKWNYFLLEFDQIKPIFDKHMGDYECEYLIEDVPGHYLPEEDYDFNSESSASKEISRTKEVSRYVKGKFLFVQKTGPYNGIRNTYDGRHGDVSRNEFRSYIECLIKTYSILDDFLKRKNPGYTQKERERKILFSDTFEKNPFKSKKGSNESKTIPK